MTRQDSKDVVTEIDNVKVFAVEQTYDDGHKEVFTVGDMTKDGRIVGFTRAKAVHPHDYWYALTDTPSPWQKAQGLENGWSWVFQLEKVETDCPSNEFEAGEPSGKCDGNGHYQCKGCVHYNPESTSSNP